MVCSVVVLTELVLLMLFSGLSAVPAVEVLFFLGIEILEVSAKGRLCC